MATIAKKRKAASRLDESTKRLRVKKLVESPLPLPSRPVLESKTGNGSLKLDDDDKEDEYKKK